MNTIQYRYKLDLQLFAAGDPIDLTLEEALTGEDLLVYSRNLETSNDYLHPLLFPPRETAELTVDVIQEESPRLPVMAKIAELGTEVEYASREGLKGTRIEIPKIQLGRYMDERLVRLALQASQSYGLRSEEQNQLRNRQLNDAQFAVDSIRARREWVALTSVWSGGVNYVEGDVRVTVDFGYTTEQKPVLAGTDKWDDIENSTPLDDIQTWVDAWRAKGIRLRRALTSQKIITLLRRNLSIRKQYHGDPSGSAQPPSLTNGQLQSVFDEMEFPAIVAYDTQARTEDRALTGGKLSFTTVRMVPENRFILLPEGPLGNYLWAKTTEEMMAEIEAEQTGDMGIYVFRDVTKNPIRVRTAGVALNFPAFAWADSVVSATVI
ncbi:Phage major capsid protein E [Paenibacillus sophorae]|uniref:Major capsid protein n=1 Tax=Paenibacillus sophorae TaxID=1333845 RepID=A0A1H8L9H8_9BACL|nr:major capsid protein [Paenibacillus sophorae]QWU17388.1 major capsid protein [Paenibacillus sophorae]SEO01378.1 Phage major capsid protein E [Paenibacillus sophorae]